MEREQSSFNPRTHTGCDFIPESYCRKHDSRFNPRTHTGCDLPAANILPMLYAVSIHAPTRGATALEIQGRESGERVSIHAPTRGATPIYHRKQRHPVCFNPRTHTGCDSDIQPRIYGTSGVSIHAPTRGATKWLLDFTATEQFQSTHPHGVRRLTGQRFSALICVSIHAPTRGATDTDTELQQIFGVSIHAPTRGATR